MRYVMSRRALLWTLQVLLALFFGLGSGAPKLLLPVDMLSLPIALPRLFVVLIGMAEVLGALGLVLPGLLRCWPALMPLAACGLGLLAGCATLYQLIAHQPANAAFAFAIGLLAVLVAYCRRDALPRRRPAPLASIEPAT